VARALRSHAPRQLERGEFEHLGPAPDHHLSVLRVNPHGQRPGAVAREQALDDRGVGRGLGADHHARRAPPEHLLDGLLGPEPAAHLHGHLRLGQEPPRQLAVVAAAEGAVEIDEVHPAGPVLREAARDGDRVPGVRGRAVRVALAQTHDAPALDVNGGKELHG